MTHFYTGASDAQRFSKLRFSILHHVGIVFLIAGQGVACSSSDSGDSSNAGGTGELSSGGTSGGELSSGGTSGGELSSGGTSGGELSSGGTSGGELSSGGASGGEASSGGAGSGLGACDVAPIMEMSCNGIICHGAPGQPAMYNTDLFNPPEGQTLRQQLVGRAANYTLVADSSSCPTGDPELLINPTVPSESLILKKITGTQACGVRMPSTGAILNQQQIDCFVDWINGVTGSSGTGGAGSGGAGSGGAGSGGAGSGGAGSGGAGSGGAGSGGMSSGGANMGGASAVPPTYETVQVILTQNVTTCVGSDCHGGHQGRVDLRVDDGLLARLTSSTSELCGMPIVDPGNPNNSALVKVLTEGCGDISPECLIGTECIPRMPLDCQDGFDCIPADYIDALRQWIMDGAQP